MPMCVRVGVRSQLCVAAPRESGMQNKAPRSRYDAQPFNPAVDFWLLQRCEDVLTTGSLPHTCKAPGAELSIWARTVHSAASAHH